MDNPFGLNAADWKRVMQRLEKLNMTMGELEKSMNDANINLRRFNQVLDMLESENGIKKET